MPKFEKPSFIPSVFASGGDANNIPASNDGTAGLASFLLGFPEITQQPIANGGIPPTRADFNGIFKFITAFLGYAQQGGMFDYDASQDYGVNALIVYNSTYYKCIAENGPDTSAGVHAPTDETYWSLLVPDDIVAAVSAASGQLKVTKKDGSQETFPIGRVTEVAEVGGVVTVTKEDGSKSTFKVVTSVNDDGGTGGNVTVSSGVIAGNVSNVNSWWVKLGGTIPLIIQGGYITAFKMNQGVEKEIIFPVEMVSFLFPAWCIEGTKDIGGIVGFYVHSGKGNGMTLLCDNTDESPTFALFWAAVGTA